MLAGKGLTFTGRMLQHLQCSLAPAVGRKLQQLNPTAATEPNAVHACIYSALTMFT